MADVCLVLNGVTIGLTYSELLLDRFSSHNICANAIG